MKLRVVLVSERPPKTIKDSYLCLFVNTISNGYREVVVGDFAGLLH